MLTGTLRLTADATRLREQQESLQALSVQLAKQSAELGAREAACRAAESEARAAGRGAEERMGQVSLWREEREAELSTHRGEHDAGGFSWTTFSCVFTPMALCAVELEERARSLEEKEQGLLFLEAQLEETSAELERRGVNTTTTTCRRLFPLTV